MPRIGQVVLETRFLDYHVCYYMIRSSLPTEIPGIANHPSGYGTRFVGMNIAGHDIIFMGK